MTIIIPAEEFAKQARDLFKGVMTGKLSVEYAMEKLEASLVSAASNGHVAMLEKETNRCANCGLARTYWTAIACPNQKAFVAPKLPDPIPPSRQ